ncbi:MAG: glycosyltransferase [bacterium]|jgi:trehalose synthase
MQNLDDYRKIVGEEVISSLYKKARTLYDHKVININSTYYGGGVAEILNTLVPLMNDAGVSADWRILRGTPDFFDITKKFHNGLQGAKVNLTQIKKNLYTQASQTFASYCRLDDDCIIIHDPQPLPLVNYLRKRQPWVWRCHIDLTNPNTRLWEYLKSFILKYDLVIVSNPAYRRDDLPVLQRVINPAIDPLSPKNMQLNGNMVEKYLEKFGVPTDKPVLCQVSRFDIWKDPMGVVEIFEKVRRKVDCRLVLCGSMAADDPEGRQIYDEVVERAKDLIESGDAVFITSENNILVNVLQRSSAVIIQKSTREGFGLTVTEALWKAKPVVASSVGGISLQIEDGETGFLLDPGDTDGFVDRIVEILKSPALGDEVGKKAREVVREKFLITRLLSDYLDLINDIMK